MCEWFRSLKSKYHHSIVLHIPSSWLTIANQTSPFFLKWSLNEPTCEFSTCYAISNPQSQSTTTNFFFCLSSCYTEPLLVPRNPTQIGIGNLDLWIHFGKCTSVHIFRGNSFWYMLFSALILIFPCLLCKYTCHITIFLIVKNNWNYHLASINF